MPGRRRARRSWRSCVAELTHLARRSPEISQRSGVSVRVSVANTEVLEAAALKRAVRLGEPSAAPRVSDLGAVIASTAGKVELESVGDDAPEERIVERLITKALFATFNRRVDVDELDDVVEAFEDGLVVETGDRTPSREYVALDARGPRAGRRGPRLGAVRRHRRRRGAGASSRRPSSSSSRASTSQRRINKERVPGGDVYRR